MKLKKNQLLISGVVIFSILVATGIWFVVNYSNSGMVIINGSSASASGDTARDMIGVHIKGEISQPGFYELPKGSYAKNLIDAAGGATENADMNSINLARILKDGEEFIVYPKELPKESGEPENSEAAEPGTAAVAGSAYQTAKPQPGDNPAAGESAGQSGTKAAASASAPKYTEKPKVSKGEKININTASAAQLARLPGIGDALAGRIIAYRSNVARFETIEDIKKVSGIGTAKFEALKEYIVV